VTRSQILLSIDWDYVTGDCAPEPQGHCGFCGYAPGLRGSVEEMIDWEPRLAKLKKFFVPRNCPIYVAECHASIMEAMKSLVSTPHVIDFDTHYDRYDENSYVHCGNWIYHLEQIGGSVDSRPKVVTKSIDMVFLCKSSPWTPATMDLEFIKLVKHYAKKSRTHPIFIGHEKEVLQKEYKNLKRRRSYVKQIVLR